MKKILMSATILSAAALASAQQQPMSPFGIGTCHARGHSLDAVDTWLPQLREIDVRWYRTPPGPQMWDVEKNKGEWDFSKIDASIAHMEKNNMGFCVLLWGSGFNGDKGLPKNDIEAWAEYVRRTVGHFKSKGKAGLYYEIWNEPPNFTAQGDTAADYAKTVAAAYDAAKSADPTAKIGIAAKSAHINWLEHCIRHGAKNKFDWVSLHPYETVNGIADNAGSDALYLSVVPTLRKMLKALNPERANVPVILTEIGCDARKGEDIQADTLVKVYLMGIAQGMAQIQWFEAMDGDSGPMGLLDGNGRKRPAYHAYGTMIKHFGQHPEYLGWVALPGNNLGYAFKCAGNKTLVAAWAQKKGETAELPFGAAELEVVESRTGDIVKKRAVTLTTSPVFILNPPAALLSQARANKTKPFPWNGDHTNAKEVSISYAPDGKVIEKGLHTTSGEAISQAVQLYGEGHAQVGYRDGSKPGGDTFICDPNFLSYKTGPIEITVTAQRKNPAQAAAIDLEYEYDNPADPSGIHPYKKERREIPEGDGWHELKWRLDDAEFNGYWGFNFRFGTGAFNIKGVSVKK
ncbi:MAG: hypothetical protein FWF96_06270 [Kiritimatiellaeota bacterium]|nr:hypothetical protein [Kiritimatiellota bacterium]